MLMWCDVLLMLSFYFSWKNCFADVQKVDFYLVLLCRSNLNDNSERFLFCFPSSVILREMNGDNWFFYFYFFAIRSRLQFKVSKPNTIAIICIPVDGCWMMCVFVRVETIFKYFPITHKNIYREMRSRNCVIYLILFTGISLNCFFSFRFFFFWFSTQTASKREWKMVKATITAIWNNKRHKMQ